MVDGRSTKPDMRLRIAAVWLCSNILDTDHLGAPKTPAVRKDGLFHRGVDPRVFRQG